MDIKGKIAVVTGAASGLGAAVAKDLVQAGAKTALLDLDEQNGQKNADDLGPDALFIKTNVADEQNVASAMDKTVEAFGGLHVAVNCAGIGAPAKVIGKKGPYPMDLFNKVLQVNLMGTVNVIRLAGMKMLENEASNDGEKGVIINTASVAAFEGQIGQISYAASKAAVVGITLPVAREFANYGIRVMTIAPGLFETPMLMGLPEKALESLRKMPPFPNRLGKSEEYACLVREIIRNAMLNGETIRLDGALRMAGK